MKKALRTEWMREIRGSLPRFLSILFLVALGVAFFSGVRATEPDMQLTIDEQYDAENIMDIRVLSTLGLTDQDVAALKEIEGVKEIEPAYTVDVLCKVNDTEKALKIYGRTEILNQMMVEQGRMPEQRGECLVDARYAEEQGIQIGDKLILKSGTSDSIRKTLKTQTYTVTGMGNYHYYLSRDRGTTTIGTGKLEGFLVVPKEDFKLEVYTDIYLSVDGAKELTTYTEEYDGTVDQVEDRIEAIKKERENLRYEQVVNDAKKEIADAEAEYKEEKHKAEKELKKAKKQLDDAKKEIDAGKEELEKAKKQLEDGKKQLEDGKKEYEKGQKDLTDGKKQYQQGEQQYQEGVKQYKQQKKQLDQGKQQLDQALKAYGITYEDLNESHGELYVQYQTYLAGKKQLEQAKKTLDQTGKVLAGTKKQLDSAEVQLKKAKRTMEESQKQLEQGQKDYEKGLKEWKKGNKEYQQGLKDYKEAKKEAEEKFAEAEEKIEDAKKEVKKLKKGTWYILDRNKIQSYVEFGQDSQRIGAIGKVFPLIFFLVAALVCLTTMTRMVEKERVQMGTMKALGYHKLQIAGKYLIYAALATSIGSILGVLIGEWLLPQIIIRAYSMMYVGVHDVSSPLHLDLGLMAAGAAFLTTLGAALGSSYHALMEVPAQLMRPEAPKEGKRVLLERIPFLWKRISFSWKSSIRNLLRYKKRFFMTIIGIGGCMALLLVGFGLKDSIFAITNNQFTQIRSYDMVVGFDEEEEELSKEMQEVLSLDAVMNGIRVREKALDIETKTGSKTGYLIVPEDQDEFISYVKLRSRTTDEEYSLEDDGVIITEKAAKMLEVEPGDTIILKEGETKKVEAKVTALAENYMLHYVFMSKDLYEELYGTAPVYNELMCNTKDQSSGFEANLSTDLLQMDGVTSISFVTATQEEMDEMLGNLNVVVLVLIIAAGLLAFVVLYNLNNINIEERRREMATLKVLGFYQSELTAYVYRENIMLTVIGTIAGIFMGIVLHQYVIQTAEVDAIMFGRDIATISYGYSIVLTFIFAILVNGAMYWKLKKIDMVESLKSVE